MVTACVDDGREIGGDWDVCLACCQLRLTDVLQPRIGGLGAIDEAAGALRCRDDGGLEARRVDVAVDGERTDRVRLQVSSDDDRAREVGGIVIDGACPTKAAAPLDAKVWPTTPLPKLAVVAK